MHERLARLWGSGDLGAVFAGGAPRSVCPFPRAGHLKGGPTVQQLFTDDLMRSPVHLIEVDPRQLWSSQPWVVRTHAAYYLTGRWERTGITSADRDRLSNRWPVVMVDRLGRLVIAAGHHRSLAALLQGRPLLARLFPSESDGAVALLPHLLVGDHSRLPHVPCDSVGAAVATIEQGIIALCGDAGTAVAARVVLATDAIAHTG